MFELKKALEEWHKNLQSGKTFLKTDIQELETHLLDEMDNLKAKGLSEQEAFWVSRSRLGEPKDLGHEFSKINGSLVWGFRIFWMALGVLSYLFLIHFYQLINGCFAIIATQAGFKGYGLWAMHIISSSIILGSIVWCCFLIYSKYGSSIKEKMSKSAKTRKVIYIVGIMLVILILMSFRSVLVIFLAKEMGAQKFGEYTMVSSIAKLIWSVVFPSILLVLMYYSRRKSQNLMEE